VQLAPVYDFAPMKMDIEGITRTTKWKTFDHGGEVDWKSVLGIFGEDEPFLRAGLQALAEKLRRLPELLGDLGLPDETLNFPGLGLARTEEKLQRWGLL
jgi:serine/threonine-protein kinase HipA